MKTLGLIASTALLFALSGTASAESYETKQDPTGVDMCFDSAGAKAPLSKCASASYLTRTDPSGGVMCFNTSGTIAPLAMCESKAVKGSPAIGLVARIARLR